MAHPVDRLVYARLLFDIGIRPRDIGFGLIIIIIADEIFNRVIGEEAFEFAVKLSRQNLVRRKDERGSLHRLDHFGDGKGLARTRHAEQHLITLLCFNPGDKFGNCGRLVTRRGIIADERETLSAFGFGWPCGAVGDEISAGFRLGERRADLDGHGR